MFFHTIAAAGILLAASYQHAVEAQGGSKSQGGSIPQALRGCWDDQFNGNSDSFLKITAEKIDVSFAADCPVYGHTILREYTTTFDTGRPGDIAVSFIARNDQENVFAPGNYSDFDFVFRPGDDNDEDTLHYCQIDYADETAEAAADKDPNVDYSDLAPDGKGCNGSPFSVMQRSFDLDCIPDKCSKICKRLCPLVKKIRSRRASKKCRNPRKKKSSCDCPDQCDCTRTRRACPSCCQTDSCSNKRKCRSSRCS